jgi:hypothetical protein
MHHIQSTSVNLCESYTLGERPEVSRKKMGVIFHSIAHIFHLLLYLTL